VDLSDLRDLTFLVIGSLIVTLDPFIDWAIGRTSIKGDQGAICHAGRNIGNAAKIEHGHRLIALPRHQRAMIGRRKRSTLPTSGNIIRAEVIGHRHGECL